MTKQNNKTIINRKPKQNEMHEETLARKYSKRRTIKHPKNKINNNQTQNFNKAKQ